MSYSIVQALKRVSKNIFIYFFIVLEISVGVTILASGVNTKAAMQDKLDKLMQQIGESYVQIESGVKDMYADIVSNQLFTHDSYNHIMDVYGKNVPVDLYLRCSVFLKCQINDEYKIDAFFVICASDRLVSQWLNLNDQNGLSKDSIYYGSAFEQFLQSKNAEEVLSDYTANSIFNVDYDKNALSINNGELLPLKKLPSDVPGDFFVSSMDIENVDTSRCIFLPFSYAPAFDNLTYISRNLYIKMHDVNSYSSVYGILDYLNANARYYTFTLTDPVAELIKGGNDTTGQIQSLTYLAAFSFVIITVGITGILMILLQRRKKGMAICYMLGATKARITFELLFEVAMVCFMGGAAGLLLSYFITPIFSVVYFEVIYKYKIVLPLIIVLLLTVNLFSCIIAAASVKESSPAQSLRGN